MNKLTQFRVNETLAIVVACFLVGASPAWARDYFVSGTGSDGNNGDSSSPLRTIAEASARLQPGDTALILPGTYLEPIKPVRAGTTDRPITYRAANPDQRPVIRFKTGILVSGLSNIRIDGIAVDGRRLAPEADVDVFAAIERSSSVTIANCDFRYANGYQAVAIRASKYVTVERCRIDFVGEYAADAGEATGNSIYVDESSSRVFITNNQLRHGGHNLVKVKGSETVVRDNFMDNSWRDIYGGEAGYRSAEIQGNKNVFERNFVARNGIGAFASHNVLVKIQGEHNIARFNVFANAHEQAIESDSGQPSPVSRRAMIYQNAFYSLGSGAWRVRFYPNAGEAVGLGFFVNNLVQKSRLNPAGNKDDADIMFFVSDANEGPTAGSRVIGNIFAPAEGAAPAIVLDGFDGKIDLARAESLYPDLFRRNSMRTVAFKTSSPSKFEDFAPAANSAAIDAGVFLSSVSTSGSGSRIPVEQVAFFSSGWGIVPGDVIQLEGDSNRATVRQVDYAGNALVLDRALVFRQGQGISLAYSGSSPDVGAFEIGLEDRVAPSAPTGLQIE